jgi:hypothetical protein
MSPGVPLTELKPKMMRSAAAGAMELCFLCPNCRKRLVLIDVWEQPAAEVKAKSGFSLNVWEMRWPNKADWGTLSLSPSINSQHHRPAEDGCTGWHGHVTEGLVT